MCLCVFGCRWTAQRADWGRGSESEATARRWAEERDYISKALLPNHTMNLWCVLWLFQRFMWLIFSLRHVYIGLVRRKTHWYARESCSWSIDLPTRVCSLRRFWVLTVVLSLDSTYAVSAPYLSSLTRAHLSASIYRSFSLFLSSKVLFKNVLLKTMCLNRGIVFYRSYSAAFILKML